MTIYTLAIAQPSLSQSESTTPTPSPALLTWSQPTTLSNPAVKSWFPDVATGVSGNVHVIWASTSQGDEEGASNTVAAQSGEEVTEYDVVMYTSSQNGVVWARANDIAAIAQYGGSEATRPSFIIDLYDRLHLTYRGVNVYYANAPSDFAAVATYWSPSIQVSDEQVAYFSDIVQDQFGKLHLVYTENSPSSECDICYSLNYRWSPDNGINWSVRQDVSKVSLGTAKPQLLLENNNNLHVAYEMGRGGSYGHLDNPSSVMVASSNDGGLTWNTPQEMAGEDENAKNITIGMDAKGQLIIVWLNTYLDVMEYRVSNDHGRTWTEPLAIPGVWGGYTIYNTTLDDYTMATDSAGTVHFVGVGRTSEAQTSLSLLYISWDGEAWSTPQAVVTLTGDVPEWPRLAIGNGNQLHLVWFEREEAYIWQSDLGKYRVLYAGATSNAPQVKGTALPEPTLTPTTLVETLAVESPTPKPSATADPVLVNIPTPSGSIFDETDEVFLIGLSILPAFLIVSAIVIIIRIKHR